MVAVGLLWLMHAVAEQRREQQFDAMIAALKKISVAMQAGESLETACSKIEGKAAPYFKRVLTLSNQMSFEEALQHAAPRKQQYLAEMLALAAQNNDATASFRRLGDALSTIRHNEKRIQEKANGAVTTLYLLVMIMPALWYALAGLLSTETLTITITTLMIGFFGMQILIVSTAGVIIFKDWKNTLLTATFGCLLVAVYALVFGQHIQGVMAI